MKKVKKVVVATLCMAAMTASVIPAYAATSCTAWKSDNYIHYYCKGELRYIETRSKRTCITDGASSSYTSYRYNSNTLGSC